MSKKLTLVDIKNSNKVFDKKERIDLSDEYHVFIYPHFSPTKQMELIKEMVTDKLRAEESGINFDNINMSDWVLFNLIYKFADLGIPSKIDKKILAFLQLIDFKYFGKIVESFPEESIQEFKESLDRFNKNLDLLMKENGMNLDKAFEEIDKNENKIVQ